jgi:shikimate dehydrogenase
MVDGTGAGTAGRSASELVGSLLAYAVQPRGNPGRLDFPRYTLPLLAHDYPALTPAMWNACYARFGLDIGNVAMVCAAADLGRVLEVLRGDERFAGGGTGVGLKSEVLPHLDRTAPLAEAAGAVNLIERGQDGQLSGHNTDGDGYVRSLEEALAASGRDIEGLQVLMLGAGGTGRAIALALARRGADIVVLNRTAARGATLADQVNRFVGRSACRAGGEDELRAEAPGAEVIVNVSTKGAAGPLERYTALAKAPLPVTEEQEERNRQASASLLGSVSRDTIVSDVVLRDGPTPTLALATELGFPTLDGVGMVIHQGVEAFCLIHEPELREAGLTRDDVASVMWQAAR